jgi:Rps23 Pro-64 3,4-dihydroxylase Tpa1-like proline 4-hydroxylase
VIQGLIDPNLLQSVRKEIQEHLHFTPKETDIYKIHQSGDLANLDGLDDSSLARLPSLLKLRDALYSPAFRTYISHVAGAGPVSGRKTDMAINVYTPTCHLLCHDDVIGTRRISYILYLTDPDTPWKAEWGGALRLYPTQKMKSEDGNEVIVPSPDFSLSIPPAFNQLSFFAIQPGESFHDVEEVYVRKEGDSEDDGGRVRMAISGWYHIPQEGEDGFEEGLEEKLAERSSLSQLQSKEADEFDLPQPQWRDIEPPEADEDDAPFSDEEMEWLLRFINPNYLTPDTVEAIQESFEENSVATLVDFLHPKFAQKLKDYIEFQDTDASASIPFLSKAQNRVNVARPPHKHRYVYRQPVPGVKESSMDTPLDQLLEHFIPSPLFARWLSLVTGLDFTHAEHMARRFRRGLDYTLATSYDEPEPQLEVCLGITPTPGWGADQDEDEEEYEDEDANGSTSNGKTPANGSTSNGKAPAKGTDESPTEPVGGYELYMAGDDADDDDAASDHGIDIPSSATGAGQRRKTGSKADPAIYKSSAEDEDDGVLFSNPASWNTLSLVLRDTGVMKFVKYVSQSAKGDRWDVVGNYGVAEEAEESGEDEAE